MRITPSLQLPEEFAAVSEMGRICPEAYPDLPSRLEEFLRRAMALYLRDSLCIRAQRNEFSGSTLASACDSAISLLECYAPGSRDEYVASLQFVIQQHDKDVRVQFETSGKHRENRNFNIFSRAQLLCA